MGSLTNSLAPLLDEGTVQSNDRAKYLNAVKMTSYLLCQFVDVFESEVTRPAAVVTKV